MSIKLVRGFRKSTIILFFASVWLLLTYLFGPFYKFGSYNNEDGLEKFKVDQEAAEVASVVSSQQIDFHRLCPADSLMYAKNVYFDEISNLSIGVYDIPPELTQPCYDSLYRKTNWTYHHKGEHVMEFYMLALMTRSAKDFGITVDYPVNQTLTYDFYYIPYFPCCNYWFSRNQIGRLQIPDLFEWMKQQPSFSHLLSNDSVRTQKQLSNHILTAGNNYAGEATGLDLFERVTTFTYEMYDEYRKYRGYNLRDIAIPYPTHEWSNEELKQERDMDFFFMGTIDRDGPPIRKRLYKLLGSDRKTLITESRGTEAYSKGTLTTRFCLAPRGDTHTAQHLFNFLSAACVPIIISDYWRGNNLPYNTYLDYSAFSYRIPEHYLDEGNEQLFYERIKRIRNDHESYRYKFETLKHVRKFFVYGYGNPLDAGDFKPSHCQLLLQLQKLADMKHGRYGMS